MEDGAKFKIWKKRSEIKIKNLENYGKMAPNLKKIEKIENNKIEFNLENYGKMAPNLKRSKKLKIIKLNSIWK